MAAAPLLRLRRCVLAGLAATLLAPSPAAGDRRDQKAANVYREGVDLARAGRAREALGLLLEAEALAPEPNEQQGSERRFLVRRYDPYYWLGVVYMELGEDEKALVSLGKSESLGVVKRWPDEWADLVRRRTILETRLAPPVPTAVAAPRPSPVPPVARDAAEAPAPAAPPAPAGPPVLAAATVSRAEPSATAGPPDPLETRRLLTEALDAFVRRDFAAADQLAARAARSDPRAPQPDVVRALVRGTQYLVGRGREPQLLAAARASLRAWRAKAGPRAQLPPVLSPALREALGAP